MVCIESGRQAGRLQVGVCFAPTARHRSPSESRHYYPGGGPPHPRVTCPRINTATDRRPNPVQPASHPLPHLLSTLRIPLHHSRVPIPILGSQHRASTPSSPVPSSNLYSHPPPNRSPCFSCRHSHPHKHRVTIALCPFVPLPFLFLLPDSRARARLSHPSIPASVISLCPLLFLISLSLCLHFPFASQHTARFSRLA